MAEYRTGLIIGRFQPLHKGHISLIKQALAIADKVIIGIGSANITDFDNPFSADIREQVLKKMIAEEKLDKYVTKIVRLDDNPSDAIWLEQVLEKAGKIDVIIGNNDRVKKILENAAHKVKQVDFYKREIYEGKKIREKMRKENKLMPIQI
jgi:nicotinamide-nucleotide adenylyltransferase